MVVRDDGETRGEGGYCVDCTASLSEGGSLTLLRLTDVRLQNFGGIPKLQLCSKEFRVNYYC